jgi:hypothetical protein
MMRVAGMSYDAIARFMDQASKTIEYHCNKPRVQAHMLALQSTFVEDLRGKADKMNERLMDLALEAVEVQAQTMSDMNDRRASPGLKQDTQIKAAALAVTTAQDILDRAYGKAPKRLEVEAHHTHAIDPAGAELIADALREAEAVDVTPYNPVRPLAAPARPSEYDDRGGGLGGSGGGEGLGGGRGLSPGQSEYNDSPNNNHAGGSSDSNNR